MVGFGFPDELRDHKKSFKIEEQYAIGGLHLLEGEVTGNIDTETTANELIAEMNDMWDEWFSEDEW